MTVIAGVVGWPITHSRSPLLHGYWIQQAGVDAAYLPFAVRPDGIETALRALPALGIAGVNVTIPHKEAALRVADSASAAAQAIGAANMITVQHDGALFADNSDAYGFRAHFEAATAQSFAVSGSVLILGAGGVARAAAYALIEAGCDSVLILNRTRRRAELLADGRPTLRVVEPSDLQFVLPSVGVIVNATSIGMGSDESPVDLTHAHSDAIVYDTVYTPLDTRLLRDARARGLRTVDGLGMLMHQACAGAKQWFGLDAAPDAKLRAILERSLA